MSTPMTTEQQQALQKKCDTLLDAVARMRGFQKEWERWHASIDKEKKRVWERNVDGQLTKENKERKSLQKTIF